MDDFFTLQFLFYILAGFLAQMIDGALGMAYKVTISSILMGLGLPPTAVSATTHAASCFTSGASAISHHAFGNIDKMLFLRLLVPGILGAILGAYVLTNIPGDLVKPYIALYLMILGFFILFKSFKAPNVNRVTTHIIPLGFGGALLDTIGGGGWGPVVTTHLIARGNETRTAIGSVNAVEFFVALTASIAFLITLGFAYVHVILGLALGGVIAAPFAAWACKHLPAQPLMAAVGALVIALSAHNFYNAVFH